MSRRHDPGHLTMVTRMTLIFLVAMITVTSGATVEPTTHGAGGITPLDNDNTAGNTTTTTVSPLNCQSIPCHHGGTCLGNGTCLCPVPYGGRICDVMVRCPADFCAKPDLNCTVFDGVTPVCICTPGFLGQRCDKVDPCYNNSCNNNGRCTILPEGNHVCHCDTGNVDKDCRLNDKDDCLPPNEPVSTAFFRTCIDKIVDHEMICQPSYQGPKCGESRNVTDYCHDNNCTTTSYCKHECSFRECNNDTCSFIESPWEGHNVTGLCDVYFGNGYENSECSSEADLFDGLDSTITALTDCSPFFNTICTAAASNGTCEPVCNNTDCLWDGMDCWHGDDVRYLAGSVVVTFYDETSYHWQNLLGLVLRAGVRYEQLSTASMSMVSLKVADHTYLSETLGNSSDLPLGLFTSVQTAARFLAASLAIRPLHVQVTDVHVCEAGKFGDKCSENCSSRCNQTGDVCHWWTGECLHDCPPDAWGPFCDKKCPWNCDDTCHKDNGSCTECETGKYGAECTMDCDEDCTGGRCDILTGKCLCKMGMFWSGTECSYCSPGCRDDCNKDDGACNCKDGYYGYRCQTNCSSNCMGTTCEKNTGTCAGGCKVGFHSLTCTIPCPAGCQQCDIKTGNCEGSCKEGYSGDNCEKQTGSKVSSAKTGVIVAIIIAVIIIIIIILAAFCYWRNKQTGDYILGDEEKNEKGKPPSNRLELEATAMAQPSPMLGRSKDMIDMDDGQTDRGVYAGPGRNSEAPSQVATVTVDLKSSTVAVEEKAAREMDATDETVLITDSPENSPLLQETSAPVQLDAEPDDTGPRLAPLAIEEEDAIAPIDKPEGENQATEDEPEDNPPPPPTSLPPDDGIQADVEDQSPAEPEDEIAKSETVEPVEETEAAKDSEDKPDKDDDKSSKRSSSSSSSSSASSKSSSSNDGKEKDEQRTEI